MSDDLPYERVTLENSDEVWYVHRDGDCRGDVCAIHKRTNHALRRFSQNFRADRELMERICDHGVGHPDPDDIAFHVENGDQTAGVHSCDGCCSPEMRLTPEQWVNRFLAATTEERIEVAEYVLYAADVAEQCRIKDHGRMEERITYLTQRVAALHAEKLALVDRYMGARA